ncbi:MAG: mannose-6-phosphate isomerase, class I, partial [Spirochaetota bacterium]
MQIFKLEAGIQKYQWGSSTAIPALLGIENPGNEKLAELWMGAHPKSPSKIIYKGRKIPLEDCIKNEPEGILGADVVRRFGSNLPFLFKVLAAGTPLSIQAHPDTSQAQAGFKRENDSHIPLDGPERNYRDSNHKPELLCALTPFWLLAGFRKADELIVELYSLNLKSIRREIDEFKNKPDQHGFKEFFERIMSLSRARCETFVDEVVEAAKDRAASKYQWIIKLNTHFPGDIGVIAPLL